MANVIWHHVCPGAGCKRAGCVKNWGKSSPVPEGPASEYPKYLGGGYVARSVEEECHMLSNSVPQGEPERQMLDALIEAEDAVHGEYCGTTCVPTCRKITAAITVGKTLIEPPAQPSPVVKTPIARYERLGKFFAEIDKAGVIFQFGLKAQGHMPTVERMRGEGKSWAEIGDRMGWLGG